MKHSTHRDWPASRPTRKSSVSIDQTTALGGLTLVLLSYIIYHFIYPLASKGLLW